MKNLLVFIAILLFSCNSEKGSSTISADSTSSGAETKSATSAESIIINNPSDTDKSPAVYVAETNTKGKDKPIVKVKPVVKDKVEIMRALPSCIKSLIEKFKNEEVQNPPRKIFSYTYKGKPVYYVPALCCDFFSDLYDDDCKLIAHPDGGITGRGDGSAPDFIKTRTHEKLLWEDLRRTR